jgi:hypothetical protein
VTDWEGGKKNVCKALLVMPTENLINFLHQFFSRAEKLRFLAMFHDSKNK